MQNMLRALCQVCAPLAENFLQTLSEHVKAGKYGRSEDALYDGGEIQLLYIRSGRMKCYYWQETADEDEKEVVFDVVKAGEFVIFPPCWDLPHAVYVQAIKNTEVYRLSLRTWQAIKREHTDAAQQVEFSFLKRERLHWAQRTAILKHIGAEERIAALYKAYPKYSAMPAVYVAAVTRVSAHTARFIQKGKKPGKAKK